MIAPPSAFFGVFLDYYFEMRSMNTADIDMLCLPNGFFGGFLESRLSGLNMKNVDICMVFLLSVFSHEFVNCFYRKQRTGNVYIYMVSQ